MSFLKWCLIASLLGLVALYWTGNLTPFEYDLACIGGLLLLVVLIYTKFFRQREPVYLKDVREEPQYHQYPLRRREDDRNIQIHIVIPMTVDSRDRED